MKDVYTLADLEDWRGGKHAGGRPIRLGVFGQPIAHSRSPEMQNAALQACGLEMRYARFEIAAHELARALQLVRELEFVGVNLTIPHKTSGIELVDSTDESARCVGAINTVRNECGKLVGSNTDGPGFSAAIRSEFGVALRGQRIVLLGAGGAGRGIAVECAREGCDRLTVVNRTFERAQELAANLQLNYGTVAEAVPWHGASIQAALAHSDLLVNATPIGLQTEDAPLHWRNLLHGNLSVYDTVYTVAPTPLLVAAREAGAKTASGLSMLLQQGALAFETWFKRAAPLREMAAALAFD